MTPEQYEQVRGLFFAMEELDSSKHASFLEDAREKHGKLILDELTSLLKEHQVLSLQMQLSQRLESCPLQCHL